MKIAVIGANGKAGKLIVQAALERGVDVSAIVRGENHSGAAHYIQKDLFDLQYEDLSDFDVVVDAFAVWDETKLSQHLTSLEHLSDILHGHSNRLIVVGGAGSLYMDESHSMTLSQTKDFPDAFKPTADNMKSGLDYLRLQKDVQWTYLSPAANFQAEGARTGNYRVMGEVFSVNDQGLSEISYADYASALVDEALEGHHLQQRISVIGI